MNLSDIKLVDLRLSKWDEKKSNRTTGDYKFADKRYVSYKDAGVRPDWWFTWVRYDHRDNYRDVNMWKIKWKYDFVTTDDPFWPEGVPPNAEGKYVFGDLILMRCPLEEYIKKREREIARSDRGAQARLESFQRAAERDGVGISQALLDELLPH